MIDLNFIKNAIPHPLLIIRFVQDPDLALAFCGSTDEKESQLTGLSLLAVRESRGPKPFRLKADIVSTVFKPRVTVYGSGSKKRWKLQIEPLSEALTVLKKPTHFVCLYAFKEEQKLGKVVDVLVEAQLSPLKMWFTLNAEHKSSKDAPVLALKRRIECPKTFTNALYNIFTGA